MKLSNTIILTSLAVALTACTKDIEYKGPDGERMLVMNSITQAGQTPVLKVSHSAYFLDTYRTGVAIKEGVNVSLDINGTAIDAQYSDSLNGFSDGRTLKEGDIVSVTASHPVYGTLYATDTVPYAQNITLTDYTKEYVPAKTFSEMFSDYKLPFDVNSIDSIWVNEIKIDGHIDTIDYYILSIDPTMTYIKYNVDSCRYDTITEGLRYKIPVTIKILLEEASPETAALEDTEIDSKYEKGKKIFIFDNLYVKGGNKLCFELLFEKPDTLDYVYTYDAVADTLVRGERTRSIAHLIDDEVTYNANIQLHVVSKTCYYYYKSVQDFKQSNNTFMSEPVTILHNIKGGLGILAAYATTERTLTHTYKFK